MGVLISIREYIYTSYEKDIGNPCMYPSAGGYKNTDRP
jgi:hypothetical protein